MQVAGALGFKGEFERGKTTLGIAKAQGYIAAMATTETSRERARIDAWLSAEKEMESLRREEIRRSGAGGIRAVIPTAALMKRLGVEPTADTGLIEQQAWFSKLRHG